jgi:hypothetical protein
MSTGPTLLCALLLFAAPTLSHSKDTSQASPLEPASSQVETNLATYSIEGVVARLLDEDGTNSALREFAPAREQQEQTGELLASWVRRFVEPAWDLESNSIESQGGESLLFRGTPQQQAWVTAWLELLRERELGFASMSASIIELPPGGLEVLGFEPDEPMGVATPAQKEKLLEARKQLDAHTGWSLLSAPRLVTRSFLGGNVSITNQLAYIKEWELTMLGDGRTTVADPVIGTVQEGLGLGLVCGPVAAGVLGLTLSLDRTDVEQPIATRKIRVATNPKTEVDVSTPIVNHVKLSSWYRVPDGGLIYFTVPSSKPDRDLPFLVTASIAPELK